MSEEKKLNIYGKLAAARAAFHELKLEKSGENKFAKYKYFELGDFLTPGQRCMTENGLCPVVTFTPEEARMTIHETSGDGEIVITSPRAEANLKGCHPIQNLGAEQTYQRRYLWMAALEVVEHDAVDAAPPAEEGATPKRSNKTKPNNGGPTKDDVIELSNETKVSLPELTKKLADFDVAKFGELTSEQWHELRAWAVSSNGPKEDSQNV